jgi:hypothetical protein
MLADKSGWSFADHEGWSDDAKEMLSAHFLGCKVILSITHYGASIPDVRQKPDQSITSASQF